MSESGCRQLRDAWSWKALEKWKGRTYEDVVSCFCYCIDFLILFVVWCVSVLQLFGILVFLSVVPVLVKNEA